MKPSQILKYRNRLSGSVDFTSKAKRRGIQRAAIELALNLLATNQEQHRPDDRFRRVPLPPKYETLQPEVPLSLPLEPWKRPLEQGIFEFTKKMLAYRLLKDSDYQFAREHSKSLRPGILPAPVNYKGPFTFPRGPDVNEAGGDRHLYLTQILALLRWAEGKAPRPFMEQLLLPAAEAMAGGRDLKHRFFDHVKLTQHDPDLLQEIAGDSWNGERQEYEEGIFDSEPDYTIARLQEFERDFGEIMHEVPLWKPEAGSPTIEIDDPNCPMLFMQKYNKEERSSESMTVNELNYKIGEYRMKQAANGFTPAPWTAQEP